MKNAKKNNACYAGYHSWAKIKGGIYEKKKKKKTTREVDQRQEGKGFSVKNKTYFERNEDCVWLANMVVSVESMRSLLRLPILIINIKKTLGTVLSLSCKSEIRLYNFFYLFFCLTNGSLAQDLFKEFI